MKKPKVAIAHVYFGVLPNYFHLWLRSCASNPDFDWFLFTEKGNLSGCSLSKNVHYIEFSKEQFETLVRSKIGVFPTRWRNYKLCDFKPAFGHLFEEYFRAFDFWGYCDSDIIWGGMSKFLTLDILEDHDRIFGSGHLSLLKNTKNLRLLYRQGTEDLDYRHVYSSEKSLIFDEWQSFYKICAQAGIRQYLRGSVVADIDPDSFTLKLVGKSENYRGQVFVWENGRILRLRHVGGQISEDEFAYIHLQKRAYRTADHSLGNSFLISPGSFVPYCTRSEAFEHRVFGELLPYWSRYLKRRSLNLKRKLLQR